MSDRGVIRPTETRLEVTVYVGNQSEITLDVDEKGQTAPALSIAGEGVQVMLFPHGWVELGEVTACDLDMAGKLVIDVTRWRDAIHAKLKAQRAAAEAQEKEEAALREAEQMLGAAYEDQRARDRAAGPPAYGAI
ncbi:hypothetical protein AB0H43_02870 [Hamadaea sp. NPDC050747]|uniref:hypothetical protein n=1 Tax=Hamadaea sp. NPDC050747 TaxID=3155789 RepID=UPI0033EFACD5